MRPWADPTAGYCKASSHIFHQAPENKWQDTVEKPAPSQVEEEMAIGLMAIL
jgi:hypothetical protein